MASHLDTNLQDWKCVKQEFRPMFPGIPACDMKMVEMNKRVKLPVTFGAPKTPGVVQKQSK